MFIENLCSPRTGNPVPNQFMLDTEYWRVMQSYATPIMTVSKLSNLIIVAGDPWGYSMTISKCLRRRKTTYLW